MSENEHFYMQSNWKKSDNFPGISSRIS